MKRLITWTRFAVVYLGLFIGLTIAALLRSSRHLEERRHRLRIDGEWQ
jgi:uncharacterized membrane protein